jgi:hypothetical protein
MFRFLSRAVLVGVTALIFGVTAGEPVTQAQYDALKKEVDDLRDRLARTTPVVNQTTPVEEVLSNKYGPDAVVTTGQGKLTMSGLLQVWYYAIQNDNWGWFDADAAGADGVGSNEVSDNDSFRIRRAELKFTMDIHENVRAVIMIDPAREATSFPTLPTNQGSGISGDNDVFYNAGYDQNGQPVGNVKNESVRHGSGLANRMLEDAYINVHGLLPHHDVSIGQMKRRLGEEGWRDSGQLDFAERAMITQLAEQRDIGLQVHGTWLDDRLQYWLGVFNGAGTAFQQRQNRADDNDEKDFVGSILFRPVWKNETWGSLELGASYLWGIQGESAGDDPLWNQVDGLNREQTERQMIYAWASYLPGGPVRGWWLRGEYGNYRDRFAPSEVQTGLNTGWGSSSGLRNPDRFNLEGWYFSTGYKLMDSIWADKLNKWVKPMEFTFRYEVMQNLFFQDLAQPLRKVDLFKTQVLTAGINYYIKGNNAKLQVTYNWVNEETPDNGPRQLREVRNDNLLINFQVGW